MNDISGELNQAERRAAMEAKNGKMRNGAHACAAATRVVGLGGAGWHMLRALAARGVGGLSLAEVNTDLRVTEPIEGVERFAIGTRVTRGLGAGGDPEVGERAARESAGEIEAATGQFGVVVLMMGLGGGTATGAAPILAAQARARGAKVAALCAMPFEFEGPRRRAQAEAGLAALREVCDLVFAFENDRLARAVDADAGVEEAFGLCGEMFARLAEAMHRALACRGLIDLDPADLSRVVGAGECGISWAEGAGPKRLAEVLEWIMEGPLLGDNAAGAAAEAVVQVTGGPELSLADVQKITKRLREVFGPDSGVSLGAAVDASMHERVRILLMVSHPAGSRTVVTPASASADVEPTPLPEPRRAPSRAKGEKSRQAALPPPPPPPPQVVEEEPVEEPLAEVLPPLPPPEPPMAEPEPELPPIAAEAEEEPEPAFGEAEPVHTAPMRLRVPFIRVETEPEEDPRFVVESEEPPMRQAAFNFDLPSRGRFDKTEVTMYKEENLDIPTFLRRRLRVEPVE